MPMNFINLLIHESPQKEGDMGFQPWPHSRSNCWTIFLPDEQVNPADILHSHGKQPLKRAEEYFGQAGEVLND